MLISLAAAAPRIYLAATERIDYDGYWHVFTAMQDNWQILKEEWLADWHPPLYYLLLRLSLWFGRSILVYRAVSLLAGIAAVFIAGKIAERMALRRATPAIAALAYGFALPSILMSIEVRSYMLCVFFVLASFYYFLDILDGQSHVGSRIGFATFAICAVASHYSAFFYVFACVLIGAAFGIRSVGPTFRRRLALDLATFFPIGGFVALLYYFHVRRFGKATGHLGEFYLERGVESLTAFLHRNAQNLFNSFSPVIVETPARFWLVLSGLILAAGCTLYLIRRPRPENNRAAATVLAAVVILGCLAAGGIFGRYPFGGYLRQQFILFPFAVVSGCVLWDRLAALIRNRRLGLTFTGVTASLITGLWAVQFHRLPPDRMKIGTERMSWFRESFPNPPAVYVDQFSLVVFFIQYDDWNWQFVGRVPAVRKINIYRVSKGTDEFLLFRDRRPWNADLSDPAWYGDLAAVIQSQTLPSLTTFCVRGTDTMPGIPTGGALKDQILQRASSANLCMKNLKLFDHDDGLSAFAQVASGRCRTE